MSKEVRKVPNKMNPKRPTARHFVIKKPKVKEKENLESSKRREASYLEGISHKTISCFSKETLQVGLLREFLPRWRGK